MKKAKQLCKNFLIYKITLPLRIYKFLEFYCKHDHKYNSGQFHTCIIPVVIHYKY